MPAPLQSFSSDLVNGSLGHHSTSASPALTAKCPEQNEDRHPGLQETSPTGLYSGHIGPATDDMPCTLTYAQNASYLQLWSPGPPQPKITSGGGRRQPITEFSERSLKRMLEWVNSIDRRELRPCRVWFITLTYPRVWPRCPSVWKSHLAALRRRLERLWERWGITWKLEPQLRGAPHWHLIAVVPEHRVADLRMFRCWLAQAWHEICGTNDPSHLLAGTSVHRSWTWRDALVYVLLYVAKPTGSFCDPVTGKPLSVGRFWGVWRRELFPVNLVQVKLTREQYEKFYLALWKYLRWHDPHQLRNRRIFASSRAVEHVLSEVLAELPVPPSPSSEHDDPEVRPGRMWRPETASHRRVRQRRKVGRRRRDAFQGRCELAPASKHEFADVTERWFAWIRGPPELFVGKIQRLGLGDAEPEPAPGSHGVVWRLDP